MYTLCGEHMMQVKSYVTRYPTGLIQVGGKVVKGRWALLEACQTTAVNIHTCCQKVTVYSNWADKWSTCANESRSIFSVLVYVCVSTTPAGSSRADGRLGAGDQQPDRAGGHRCPLRRLSAGTQGEAFSSFSSLSSISPPSSIFSLLHLPSSPSPFSSLLPPLSLSDDTVDRVRVHHLAKYCPLLAMLQAPIICLS